MSHVIDLREPPKDLPPIEFELSLEEFCEAALAQAQLVTQRNERTAQQRKQG